MLLIRKILAPVLCLCLAQYLSAFGAVTCATQTAKQDQTKARNLFLAVERAARLQPPQQDLEIAHIYRDVWPVLEREMLTAWGKVLPPIRVDQRNLTPEELADSYERQGGWPLVAEAARVRCLPLLSSHVQQVEALAREDLGSKNRTQLQRGLRAAGAFHLSALYNDVASQLDGAEEDLAANALRDLNDPRAIPLLARHGITKHFDMLRSLQRGRSANPELVAFLNDKNPEVRWRAAYALAESGDPRLAPTVKRLARDEASEVRIQAANIAFLLPSDTFVRLRPVLVKLLTDKSVDVKSSVVILFATRKDAACTRSLYDLLAHEEKLAPWLQSNLAQALQTLTGSYFGFIPGTISTESARRASLEQFAHWISNNARESQ